MRKLCLWCLVIALVVPASFAVAQMAAKKYEGTWYQVVNVDFKEGMKEKALAHIAEHFVPAGIKIGTHPFIVLVHETGPWDITVVWTLKNGPADMEWAMSPDDVRWMQAMAEQEGSMEAAQKAWQDYVAMIDHSEVTLAHAWGPAMAPEEGDSGTE